MVVCVRDAEARSLTCLFGTCIYFVPVSASVPWYLCRYLYWYLGTCGGTYIGTVVPVIIASGLSLRHTVEVSVTSRIAENGSNVIFYGFSLCSLDKIILSWDKGGNMKQVSLFASFDNFLAVHNSSIGDLTHSLTHSLTH